jgi:hypothetical protein
MRHADERPRDGKERETDLQAEHVQHVAGQRLHHDRDLERGNDIGILLRADVQVLHQRRRSDAKRTARQVVDDRPEHQQPDHPPAQSLDGPHQWVVVFMSDNLRRCQPGDKLHP